jgi:hypothetical protein
VLSLRLHSEADDPLNPAKNPFFDWMLHTSKSVYITIFNNPVTPFPHNSVKQIFQDPAHTFSSGKTLAMKTTIWITSPKV